jgi:FkbM family methyltransferase
MAQAAPQDIPDKLRNQLISYHKLADSLFNRYRFFGSRKLYRKISKIILPQLKSRTFIPTIFGFDLVVGPDNAFDYYYLGFYEMGALNFFKNVLTHGDVFVDVGANIGLMSFYSSPRVGQSGKVLAVEPTQRFFDDLENGIRKNNFKNILPLKIGLGSTPGKVPIYHNSVCPSMIQTGSGDPSEIIEIQTLDSVLERHAVSKVKLIKIDVEGFELEVVKGGQKLFSSAHAPVVCIEYVRNQQMITENGMTALDFLKKINSYKFYQLENSSDTIGKLVEVKSFADLHDNDNVFCVLENQVSEYKHLIK